MLSPTTPGKTSLIIEAHLIHARAQGTAANVPQTTSRRIVITRASPSLLTKVRPSHSAVYACDLNRFVSNGMEYQQVS